MCVLGVVDGALSVGEVWVQGAGSVVLARVRSPALSGHHGGDMDAGDKGVSLCNSCRGQHGEWRCVRGVLLDTLGRPVGLCGRRRERGGKDGVRHCCAFDAVVAGVVQGTRGHWFWRERGVLRETREMVRGGWDCRAQCSTAATLSDASEVFDEMGQRNFYLNFSEIFSGSSG